MTNQPKVGAAREQSNMSNDAVRQCDDETNSKSIEQLIEMLNNDEGKVNIDISLARVSSILQYLAQCDFALAESRSDFNNDWFFGRHDLMLILNHCVEHFHQKSEARWSITQRLQQIVQEKDAQSTAMLQLHGLYQQLIELAGAGASDDLTQLKMNITRAEINLSLQQSDALVNFTR